jgi:PAS domain S-box-containing protein
MSALLQWILVSLVLASVIALAWFQRKLKRADEAKATLEEANRDLGRQLAEKESSSAPFIGSEARLIKGIDDVGAALWEWDLIKNTFFASDLILKSTGYTNEDVAADLEFIMSLIHPDDRILVQDNLRIIQSGNKSEVTLEFRLQYSDKEYHWINTRIIMSHDQFGNAWRLVGSFSDISDRISAEEERDRLFNLSIDMLAVWGFDGVMDQVNPAWVRLLGWSRDELMGQPLLFFVHPEDQEMTKGVFDTIFSGQPVEELDLRFRCRNGSYLWLSWSSFPYPDRQVVFSVVKDITHNKMAERKLLDYQERLRSLSSQLSLVEDRQRKELASAIHDGLAQQLFGIRAKVTLLKYPEKTPDIPALVQETLDIIDETMSQARNLSFELFPPVLHEVGLEAALGWLGHHFEERTGIACHLNVDGQGPELDEDIRTIAFQSVRELLANIHKHSGASDCHMTLNHVEGYITILVEDGGHGFDVSASRDRSEPNDPRGGFGLFSIRERMRSLDGRMLVDSRPGKGCRVFLTFPNGGSQPPAHPLKNPEY